jgi:hypothetical protein
MKRRKTMAGHTPWREIRRKKHERIARQVVECWLEDCVDVTLDSVPDLSTIQLRLLLNQVEVGIMRGGEDDERGMAEVPPALAYRKQEERAAIEEQEFDRPCVEHGDPNCSCCPEEREADE